MRLEKKRIPNGCVVWVFMQFGVRSEILALFFIHTLDATFLKTLQWFELSFMVIFFYLLEAPVSFFEKRNVHMF